MRRVCCVVASLALLLSASGCGTLAGLFDPAGRLLDDARAALERRDLDVAYDDLMQIHTRYPESPEDREAFPLAVAIARHGFFRDRYEKPDSRWVTREPGAMLDWFSTYLAGPAFPQAEAEALFVGNTYEYYRLFLRHPAAEPALRRWRIHVEDDNGFIEAIAAEPAAP